MFVQSNIVPTHSHWWNEDSNWYLQLYTELPHKISTIAIDVVLHNYYVFILVPIMLKHNIIPAYIYSSVVQV